MDHLVASILLAPSILITHESTGDLSMKLARGLCRWKIWHDTHGQDMIEYALLAGFVAVAAGASLPPVAGSISTIFSKMVSIADEVP